MMAWYSFDAFYRKLIFASFKNVPVTFLRICNHEIPSLGFPDLMSGSKATNVNDQYERRGLGKRKEFSGC